MSAHQPNLFAYSGVFRKITLIHTFSKDLEERLNLPVLPFFGIADQDFTDDRWVSSSLLPAIERREGILTLNINLPKNIIHLNESIIKKRIYKSEINKFLHPVHSNRTKNPKSLYILTLNDTIVPINL